MLVGALVTRHMHSKINEFKTRQNIILKIITN